jgi:shikimate dehydrogenase
MSAGTLRFGLLGHGIAYSASPAMMRAAFAALGLPHRYDLIDVAPEALPGAVAKLRAPDVGGANVTTPHKAGVAALVDERSPEADRAEAVNTVVRADGRLVGHNTDLPATIDALGLLCPEGIGHALILGAGGVGRSVALALAERKAGRISVVRRADGSWGRLPLLVRQADLLVNATPVGTGSDETPVPPDLLRPDLRVLDLVYRPSPTRLVREARVIGARAASGWGVLLGQAWRSLELWLGRSAPVDAMRAALRAELGADVDG